MRKLLQALKDTRLVKITGSYADGTQKGNSDIDFYVKPDRPDTLFTERNMLKIIELLRKYNVKWESTETGYIFTHQSKNSLCWQLDFSDRFCRMENKLPRVVVKGVEFQTY